MQSVIEIMYVELDSQTIPKINLLQHVFIVIFSCVMLLWTLWNILLTLNSNVYDVCIVSPPIIPMNRILKRRCNRVPQNDIADLPSSKRWRCQAETESIRVRLMALRMRRLRVRSDRRLTCDTLVISCDPTVRCHGRQPIWKSMGLSYCLPVLQIL